MKNDYPIKAQALGGRHYRNSNTGQPYVDQNFDSYAVEYTFKDGTKLYYKDWGHGEPVVLLHGWPLNSDSFDDAALRLVLDL